MDIHLLDSSWGLSNYEGSFSSLPWLAAIASEGTLSADQYSTKDAKQSDDWKGFAIKCQWIELSQSSKYLFQLPKLYKFKYKNQTNFAFFIFIKYFWIQIYPGYLEKIPNFFHFIPLRNLLSPINCQKVGNKWKRQKHSALSKKEQFKLCFWIVVKNPMVISWLPDFCLEGKQSYTLSSFTGNNNLFWLLAKNYWFKILSTVDNDS